jgi:hypothetical protein
MAAKSYACNTQAFKSGPGPLPCDPQAAGKRGKGWAGAADVYRGKGVKAGG